MAYTTVPAILAHIGGKDRTAGDRLFDEATIAVATVDDVIDDYCQRTFEVAKQPETRMFAPKGYGYREMRIGDVQSISLVETRTAHTEPWAELQEAQWQIGQAGRTWPASTVWMLPGEPDWPYAPPPVETVRITAMWGWASTPPKIKQAALYWAVSLVQEKALPLTDASGDIVSVEGDAFRNQALARRLLAHYRIVGVG